MKKLSSLFVGFVVIPATLVCAQPGPAATVTPATLISEQSAINASVASIPAPPRPNAAIIPGLNPRFMRAHTNNVVIAKRDDIDEINKMI